MKKYLFILAAVAVLMASCSPFALVNSETYNNADLADYSTFRIVTPADGNRLPPGMEMVTYYNIAAAIREQMLERGFKEDPSSPLLINIGLTVHREIDTAPALLRVILHIRVRTTMGTILSSCIREPTIGLTTMPMLR